MTRTEANTIAEDSVRDLPALIPVPQVAELLGVTGRTIRRWASVGRIVVLKTARGRGARALVPRESLRRFLVELAESA
jgi:excisionase family DNA binding protein